jgi:hypothetical protein
MDKQTNVVSTKKFFSVDTSTTNDAGDVFRDAATLSQMTTC